MSHRTAEPCGEVAGVRLAQGEPPSPNTTKQLVLKRCGRGSAPLPHPGTPPNPVRVILSAGTLGGRPRLGASKCLGGCPAWVCSTFLCAQPRVGTDGGPG